MSEIEVYRPSGAVAERDVIDGWIQVADDVSKLANFIAETDFVPKALRNKPAAVAACILTGRELQIGPMQALKAIHMVQGTPSLSAEYKRARALAAGHEIVFDETTASRCVVRGRRAGSDRWVTVTWTLDMAKRAKLTGKEVWQAYPQRMLQARATSELCDLLFPDASLGLATTEVIEDGGDIIIDGQPADAASGSVTASTAPAETAHRRTAQRKTRTAPKDTPPASAAPPVAAAPAQDAGGAMPPLPGEDEQEGAPGSAPDDTDYDSPGTVTPDQLTKIWTVLGSEFHFGSDEKDQARKVCAHIAGRDLETSKNLSCNEAKAVLDTLGHWQHQAAEAGEDPRAWMLAAMQPEGDGDR